MENVVFLLRLGLEKLQASVKNEQWTGHKSNPALTPGKTSWVEGNSWILHERPFLLS